MLFLFQFVHRSCAECTVSLVGQKTKMAAISVSAPMLLPNQASVQLCSLARLARAYTDAELMTSARETRNAALMAAAMFAPLQSIKVLTRPNSIN